MKMLMCNAADDGGVDSSLFRRRSSGTRGFGGQLPAGARSSKGTAGLKGPCEIARHGDNLLRQRHAGWK